MSSLSSKARASGLSLLPQAPGSPPAPRSKSPTMPSSSTPPSPTSRPPAPRAHTFASSANNSLSVPSTPYHTPHVSSVNVVSTSRRLLMPTVRAVRPTSPRVPNSKPSPSKLGRGRAGSLPVSVVNEPQERTVVGASEWLPGGEKFEVVEEQLELEGFQIYAVEKWVVARKRPVLVLTVFTGDPKHKITVTALSPQPCLSSTEAQAAWDDAIRSLRREGARPKETEKGVLMVTSLANFRSDFTIVHIPSGNFLDVREQLYSNVNLLRMGCGGRSALTLEEPSDATKDRFVAMYHVADKAPARSRELFSATVLELVKLIQASLAIFGMFDLDPEERNGLLCDVTCEGIQRWVTEIGEQYLNIEPTERVAEPTVIAALFSLIVSIRSKLFALGVVVPKDPFLDPIAFVKALTAFYHKSQQSSSHSHLVLPTTPTIASSSIGSSNSGSPVPPLLGPSASPPSVVFLTQSLIETIEAHYEKSRQSESYKVHRVLKNKLDDLATDLRTHGTESGGPTTVTTLSVTTDLAALARCATTSKDAPQSLRYLWTGRAGHAEKKRREKEAVWSDGEREREEKERERDGEKDVLSKDGRDKDERDRDSHREARSGDEWDRPWGGRMQRKIESWAGLGKGKKLSVDFGTLGKAFLTDGPRGLSEKSGQSSLVPSVVVSRDPADEEEFLSSGQQSPTSDVPNPLMLGVGSLPSAERSASDVSEYDRRVSEFNHRRPPIKSQSRIVSWSDARTARGLLHDHSSSSAKVRHHVGASPLGRADSSPGEDNNADMDDLDDMEKELRRRRVLAVGPYRRRSFDDALDLADTRILPVERMRIDVELCGQLLVMRRREAHLANVVACLQALASKLAAQNAKLHADHEGARGKLAELDARAGELQRLEALRTEAEALTQETNALAYESAQFLVEDLWHMAVQPRQRVLALREKVFGTGRRLPQGVRGAHGPFNRVQWRLDGEQRLVDRLGRTENEAEEEEEFPVLPGMDMESEEEGDAVEHPSLKPTWLLRFFNYWGGRLGLSRTQEPPVVQSGTKENGQEQGGEQSQSQENGNGIKQESGESSALAQPALVQRTPTSPL
ncbi:hypothetical protein BD309DRAFT_947112 [Dichomitus squalens]|uniref:STB6-like N-terminal domain-containing protein n=1 Tax=Dichomitus squalens TaxID=114155 RepID=A0A4V2K5T3_9APHY|nr:hypothetical protein BD309DRAFT_947112 [Dichomitus squalens]TBU59087.1 hypothetical protein BD310DRAFT_849848 [Dichomitus squalens]